MATKRTVGREGREETEDSKVEDKQAESLKGGASTKTKDGLSKKQRMYKEQQKWKNRVRWTLSAVLLLLLAIGLYYYFSIDSPRRQKRPLPSQANKPRQEKAKGTESSSKGKESSSNRKESSSKGKESSSKGKESSSKRTSGKGKKKHVDKKTEEAKAIQEQLKNRILRQPILVDDPDRPYAIDLVAADNLLIDKNYPEALEQLNAILSKFPQSPRAQFGKGITLSHMAREKKSLKLLDSAIDFFRAAGLDSIIASESIRVASLVAMVDKAEERGKGQLALRGMEKLVELRSDNVVYANQLGMLYLKHGKEKKAKAQFKKNVERFEDDYYGQAQLGYILYMEKHYEKALPLLINGIRNNKDIRRSGSFYNYAGDTLTRLNRSQEALALYGEGVSLGLFPSVWQRSLVNERGLRSFPWWSPDTTGYMTDITRVEKTMDTIASEALAIFDEEKRIFQVSEEKGTPHYLLFSNGKKNVKNCLSVPKTCALMESFPEASGCNRGTIKFSSIPPRTHISPHVGDTNMKLQVVAGLKVDQNGGIRIRMAEETKILGRGQIGIIDESFEKEVWYIGEEPAVYLTIDVWHPDLSQEKREQLRGGPVF